MCEHDPPLGWKDLVFACSLAEEMELEQELRLRLLKETQPEEDESSEPE